MTGSAGTIYWGRYLVSFDADTEAIADGAIHVAAGSSQVDDLGPIAELRLRHPGAEEIGGPDYVVIPGLIDAHQHGRPVTPAELGCWDETLELWLLEQRGVDRPHPVLMARVAAMRALLGGVTTMLHPHITGTPGRWVDEMLEVAAAYAGSGMRVVFGMDVRDRGSYTYEDDDRFLGRIPASVRAAVARHLPPSRPPALDELEDGFGALRSAAGGTLVTPALAPRGPQWCSGPLLDWVAQQSAEGALVQVHASETLAQYGWFAADGASPVRHLDAHGLLSSRVTLAHCVWLDTQDVARIAGRGAVVAHNPTSNLRLQSGRAPTAALRAAGVPIGIGTDSTGTDSRPDLFAEMRLARWLEQVGPGAASIVPERHLRETLRGGAAAAGQPDVLGRLAVGTAADLVLLAWDALTPGGRDVQGAVVPRLVAERATRHDVAGVVVAGRQVVREGRYLIEDADALEAALGEAVGRLAPAVERQAAVRAVRPHVVEEVDRLHARAADVDFVR